MLSVGGALKSDGLMKASVGLFVLEFDELRLRFGQEIGGGKWNWYTRGVENGDGKRILGVADIPAWGVG